MNNCELTSQKFFNSGLSHLHPNPPKRLLSIPSARLYCLFAFTPRTFQRNTLISKHLNQKKYFDTLRRKNLPIVESGSISTNYIVESSHNSVNLGRRWDFAQWPKMAKNGLFTFCFLPFFLRLL